MEDARLAIRFEVGDAVLQDIACRGAPGRRLRAADVGTPSTDESDHDLMRPARRSRQC